MTLCSWPVFNHFTFFFFFYLSLYNQEIFPEQTCSFPVTSHLNLTLVDNVHTCPGQPQLTGTLSSNTELLKAVWVISEVTHTNKLQVKHTYFFALLQELNSYFIVAVSALCNTLSLWHPGYTLEAECKHWKLQIWKTPTARESYRCTGRWLGCEVFQSHVRYIHSSELVNSAERCTVTVNSYANS